MRILLIAPSDRTSAPLIEHLVGEGHQLVFYTRAPGASDPEREGVEVVQGEVDQLDRLRAAAEGCEVIVHLPNPAGASLSLGREALAETQRLVVRGTRRVVEVALGAKVRRLIHVSSHLAAGDLGLTPLSALAQAHLLAERDVWRAAAKGAEVLVLAPAHLVGCPGSPIERLLVDLSDDRIPLFPADSRIGLLDQRDLVAALSSALSADVAGEGLVLQGARLGWRQLGDMVGLATGWPVSMRRVSPRTARAAARLEAGVLSRLRRRAPAADPAHLAALIHDPGVDGGPGARALGIEYSDVAAALRSWLERLVAAEQIGAA